MVVLAGYLVYVYWSVGEDYAAIRFSAQKLANRIRRDGVVHAEITAMRAEVKRETGIDIYGSKINVTTPARGARVVIETELTAHFPLIDRVISHPIRIEVEAKRK